MRFLVQRVEKASVTAEGRITGIIGKGLVVFVGVENTDTSETAEKMTKKLIGLRIFEDANGKTNLNLKSVGGSLLIVSQFTLYADCRRGNRPSFTNAGDPQAANTLYRYIIEQCRREIETVEEGVFGAEMKVELINDGPFTIWLDSEELF